MARTCLTIILAAGEGTRMRSAIPKVLHEVAGLSLLGHVMRAAGAAGGNAQAVVVGREAERVDAEARRHAASVVIAEQKERLGTGHAVLAARAAIAEGYDDVLVLFGDTPLITAQSLQPLRAALAEGAAVAVMGFRTDAPDGYGRLIEEDGQLVAIREHKDASEAEREITFCNGGIMGLSGKEALDLLDAIGNDNAKGEYYLTDCVAIARERGFKVVATEADEEELIGINDRRELARVEALWQARKRLEMMAAGVSLQAPESVHFCFDTVIGADSRIEPDVWFGPGVSIGEHVHIRAFSHIEGAEIGDHAVIGPFARLRPGTRMAEKAKVGNFCEIKNASVEEGAKINHLSYIGDARVGAGANIGAGTITCNYDGYFKYQTEIGDRAFIGSNSALIAPVKIGADAIVAAGSAVSRDVDAGELRMVRADQLVKPGWADRFHDTMKKKKAEKKDGPKK